MKFLSLPLILPLGVVVAFGGFSMANHHDKKAELKAKIEASLPDEAFATPVEKRKLLVFSRTNGFRHKSIDTGKLALQLLGHNTGAFETVISDDLANFDADKLKEFSAVCFLNTTGEVFSASKKEMASMSDSDKKADQIKVEKLQRNLMAFIKGGGGFIGIHSATDTFYQWPEYGEMMNGYFWGHPWSSSTSVSIKVDPGKEAHPLVSMFEGENLEFQEEIYQYKDPYNSQNVNILLRLDTEKSEMNVKGIRRTDNDFGVSWNRDWGEGRVFYCSLGHNHHIYSNEKVLKHYLAGIQWAIGDYKIDQ